MAIVHSIKHLKTLFHEFGNDNRDIYMTSGGFDPIHVGHVRCIQSTYKMANDSDVYPSNHTGIVVVIVNADSFLIRKKGYAFMPLQERMEIIDAIEGVDFVVPWETDGDKTVIGALSLLKPKFFITYAILLISYVLISSNTNRVPTLDRGAKNAASSKTFSVVCGPSKCTKS